jgi:hypothetical protein
MVLVSNIIAIYIQVPMTDVCSDAHGLTHPVSLHQTRHRHRSGLGPAEPPPSPPLARARHLRDR